jgi:hypothetical protein
VNFFEIYILKRCWTKGVRKVKKIVFLLIISVFFFSLSIGHAALIGIKESLDYPDILFDTSGTIKYTASDGLFVLNAYDRVMTMSDGTEYSLTETGFKTNFNLRVVVDTSGKIIGLGTMEEKVTLGTVFIGEKSYGEGTQLLTGAVYNFGWGEGVLLGQFDFLVNNLHGALIDDHIWPSIFPTGIFAMAEILNGWTGSWSADFKLEKVHGDKAPLVPIPPALILLGSGLLGLAGLGRLGRISRRKD